MRGHILDIKTETKTINGRPNLVYLYPFSTKQVFGTDLEWFRSIQEQIGTKTVVFKSVGLRVLKVNLLFMVSTQVPSHDSDSIQSVWVDSTFLGFCSLS